MGPEDLAVIAALSLPLFTYFGLIPWIVLLLSLAGRTI